MHRRLVIGLAVAVAVAVLIGGLCPALAQPQAPPPVLEKTEPPPTGFVAGGAAAPVVVEPNLPLSALLQRAGAAFAEGRYDEAIAYLSVADARQLAPPILFNIGQAHRKAGHTQKALETYERFLRDYPRSPLLPEAAAHADAMRAQLAAEQATVKKAEAEQHARELSEQAERAAQVHEAERLQADAALRKEVARKEQPVYKRGWFWGLLGGLVAAGVVAGVVVGVTASPPPEPAGSLGTQEVRF